MSSQSSKFFTPTPTKSGADTNGEETEYILHKDFVKVLRQRLSKEEAKSQQLWRKVLNYQSGGHDTFYRMTFYLLL